MSTTPTTYTMLSTGTFRMTDGSAAYRFTAGDIIPMQLAIALGLPGAGYTERSVFNATEEAEIVSLTETDLLTSLADSESDVAGAVETIAAAAANVVITVTLPTAASVVDQSVFIADRAYEVLSVAESHVVAGTDGSAVTLDVKKCTGIQAPSAGTSVFFSGTLDLKGTAGSVRTAAMNGTTLSVDHRLAFDITGTPTSYAGGVVTIVLSPI